MQTVGDDARGRADRKPLRRALEALPFRAALSRGFPFVAVVRRCFERIREFRILLLDIPEFLLLRGEVELALLAGLNLREDLRDIGLRDDGRRGLVRVLRDIDVDWLRGLELLEDP